MNHTDRIVAIRRNSPAEALRQDLQKLSPATQGFLCALIGEIKDTHNRRWSVVLDAADKLEQALGGRA